VGTCPWTTGTKALQDQRGKAGHLGELLLQRGLVTKTDLAAALGELTTASYIDCTTVRVPAEVLRTIPASMARRCLVLPIKLEGNRLTVAMAEPQNLQLVDELRFKTGKEIVPLLGFHSELRDAAEKHYGQEVDLSAGGKRSGSLIVDAESMESISSSDQQRNVEAMRGMQA
jgi:type II secretory ATPase GspE/PulE/Tfp pilus assembly ATPase PilB-like protein